MHQVRHQVASISCRGQPRPSSHCHPRAAAVTEKKAILRWCWAERKKKFSGIFSLSAFLLDREKRVNAFQLYSPSRFFSSLLLLLLSFFLFRLCLAVYIPESMGFMNPLTSYPLLDGRGWPRFRTTVPSFLSLSLSLHKRLYSSSLYGEIISFESGVFSFLPL